MRDNSSKLSQFCQINLEQCSQCSFAPECGKLAISFTQSVKSRTPFINLFLFLWKPQLPKATDKAGRRKRGRKLNLVPARNLIRWPEKASSKEKCLLRYSRKAKRKAGDGINWRRVVDKCGFGVPVLLACLFCGTHVHRSRLNWISSNCGFREMLIEFEANETVKIAVAETLREIVSCLINLDCWDKFLSIFPSSTC